MNVSTSQFREILTKHKKITVVGISPNPSRPSQQIAVYMKENGYDVVGVNPGHEQIAGIKVYKTLADVPADYRQFVDVFRSPENMPELVEEVLKIGGVKVLWLQLGVGHPVAEKKAEDKGLQVISNHCLLVEHRRFM